MEGDRRIKRLSDCIRITNALKYIIIIQDPDWQKCFSGSFSSHDIAGNLTKFDDFSIDMPPNIWYYCFKVPML